MNSLQGQFLIAAPKLLDRNFARAVVLMVRHGDDGALGLIVNRPLETRIDDIWEQVSETSCTAEGAIYQGGPCDGPLMVLHTDSELSQVQVIDGVHFTTDKDMIEQLVAQTKPRLKFFVGYAGWAVGQLESELADGSWLTMPAAEPVIFTEGENLWDKLYKQAHRANLFPGLDPRHIPDDPTVN